LGRRQGRTLGLPPDRGFDAVVVGEYEWAFFGDQLTEVLPLLAEHGCNCGCRKPAVPSTALIRFIRRW
jgi:hypothetical protein